MKGTKSKHLLFQLVPLVRRTEGIEFGLLPTVTAQDFKRRGPNSKQQGLSNTENYYGLLPTPTASDWKGGCDRTEKNEKFQHSMLQHSMHFYHGQTGKTSQLNPQFVAEMMGFPINWTELPFLNGETNPSKDTETQ
jgi:hypothetical protein